MNHLRKPAVLLATFVILVTVVAVMIVFARPNPTTQPTHQLSAVDARADDAITLNGHVAFNSYLACLEENSNAACDETYPQFINLQTADELVTIIYSTEECRNPGVISQGQRSRPGGPVEVFARVTEQGTLSACPSAEYYIQPIARENL